MGATAGAVVGGPIGAGIGFVFGKTYGWIAGKSFKKWFSYILSMKNIFKRINIFLILYFDIS